MASEKRLNKKRKPLTDEQAERIMQSELLRIGLTILFCILCSRYAPDLWSAIVFDWIIDWFFSG